MKATVTYYDKWLVTEAFPLLFLTALGLVYLLIRLVYRLKPSLTIPMEQLGIDISDYSVKRYDVEVSFKVTCLSNNPVYKKTS